MESPGTAMARKYRALATLRRTHAATGRVASAAELRALAREFPGALRELDITPLDQLEARAATAESAGRGEIPAPVWLTTVWGYHGLMRAALAVKRALGRGEVPDPDRAHVLAARATALAGVPVDAAFVQAVARPPAGRITPVVLERLGTHLGVDPAALRRSLVPSHRDGP